MIPTAKPMLGRECIERIEDVIETGQLADGPEVRRFEEEFAAYCGTNHGVATSNGTTALHAALIGLEIGVGDRVLTSPFSFVASANAPRLAGAEVDFVDIDPETYTIDPGKLEERLKNGEQIDAVIAVHLYGLPADLGRLSELADEYGFALIEDAAQAHGATFDSQRVGSFGDAGCFSFYPTKNMTTGEGGMITTDRYDVARRASRFIDHGRDDEQRHTSLGHNFRMTSIAAAIGQTQLERLPEFIAIRQENADRLTKGLEEVPIKTPKVPADRTHVYNQYTIEFSNREYLRDRLQDNGIASAVYYPQPIHQLPAFEQYEVNAPVAERVCDKVLSLPVHPSVTGEMIDWIIQNIDSQVRAPA